MTKTLLCCLCTIALFLTVASQPIVLQSLIHFLPGCGVDIVWERMKIPDEARKFFCVIENSDPAQYTFPIIDASGREFNISQYMRGGIIGDSWNDTNIMLFQSYTEVYRQRIEGTSISAVGTIDGIDLSLAFQRTRTEIDKLTKNETRQFAQFMYKQVEYGFAIWEGAPLDFFFTESVKALPSQYNAAKALKLFQQFGTHVLSQCFYGISFNLSLSIDNEVYNHYHSDEVVQQINLAVGKNLTKIGFNNSFDDTSKQVDQYFASHTTLQNLVTGNADVLNGEGFAAWVQSAKNSSSPILTDCSASPISDFVALVDPSKEAWVKQAIIDYANGNLHVEEEALIFAL